MIRTTAPAPAARPARPRRAWRSRALAAALAALAAAAGLGAWLAHDQASLAALADLARSAVGPGPVARVEELVFTAQDRLQSERYRATGAAPSMEWSAPPAAAQALPPGTAPDAAAPDATSAPDAAKQQQAQASGDAADSPSPVRPGDPVAWAPFVTDKSGAPIMERAIIAPDPERPYVRAAVVRFDLRRTRLHLVAGTTEPQSAARIVRTGAIPAAALRDGSLLAAFNGGFKAANGAFGMALGSVTLLDPRPGLATVAIYRDGSVRLGVWGADIGPSPDMVAMRQNCPLLVDGGRPTVLTAFADPLLWGNTVKNQVATWRSGLGVSADGRYLIYVVGDGLTIGTLADSLADAGAGRGMQLDINTFWTRFVTFSGAPGHLRAVKLLRQMPGDDRQFLAPDTRDFFYVTRQG